MSFLQFIYLKKETNNIFDYPIGHISSYLSVTDEQLKSVEHYLEAYHNFNVKEQKQEIKERIYLTKDTLADGREYVCINFPRDFKYMVFLSDNKSADQAIKNTNIVRYHSVVAGNGGKSYTFEVAAAKLNKLPNGKEQISELAYERRGLYTRILVDLYNGIIDKINKNTVVDSIVLDEWNKSDF